jgi:hypothetical protein
MKNGGIECPGEYLLVCTLGELTSQFVDDFQQRRIYM